MRQRRLLQGISVAILGLALACAPMAVASANNNNNHHKAKSHHHSKSKPKAKSKTKSASKGSDSSATICTDVKNSQTSSASLAPGLEKAFESGATGSFASLQQALLAELNAPLKAEGEALSVLSSAPANVQAAMKGIIGFFGSFKSAVASATNLTQLEQSLQSLGNNATLQADAMTLENYVTSLCGTITPTT
ncbi:MAG: hypothetical protein ACLQRH_09250 [Acidimicrobiales bacterium]